MEYQKEAFEFNVEELDRELVIRGAQKPREELFHFSDPVGTPQRSEVMRGVQTLYDEAAGLEPDPSMSHISTEELTKVLLYKTGRIEIGGVRGPHGKDDRKDLCDITDNKVIENAESVAALCSEDDLVFTDDGYAELKIKNYGKLYDLCTCEPFHYQPVTSGLTMSCCLVKEDVVATAYHCIKKIPVKKIRIIFGYRMTDRYTPNTRIPVCDIYKAIDTSGRAFNSRDAKAPEWAMIKLNDKVRNRPTVELNTQTSVSIGQKVYVLGHPLGLPLKFAPDGNIQHIENSTFVADLDIYSGNSGSPIFDACTHKFIGVVTKGDASDFIKTGNCFVSIIYPKKKYSDKGPRCTQLSEFSRYLA